MNLSKPVFPQLAELEQETLRLCTLPQESTVNIYKRRKQIKIIRPVGGLGAKR